jgi:uncharacterized protein YggE
MRRLLLPLLLLPFAALGQPRTISVTGDAMIRVVPDQVVINLGIDTYETSLDDTTRTNTETGERLMAALKALGIADRDVHIDTLELRPVYPSSDNSHGVVGYTAGRSYAITVHDREKVEKIVRAALDAGVNVINGIDFQTTELRKYRDEARQKAIRAAYEKAKLLAGEVGARVGAPITISEGSQHWFYGYRMANPNVMMQNSVSAAGEDSAPIGEEGIALGQVSVTASVNVTFELLTEPPAQPKARK